LRQGFPQAIFYSNMKSVFLPLSCFLIFVSLLNVPLWAQPWPKVDDVDLSRLKPSDFKDDELDLPYYLKHFHTVANSVVESGPDKGFINIVVWRRPPDNKPYNARIMENVLSLAYFYSTDRPWNPYYKSAAVKVRIEAALNFWINRQDSSGRFSEYGPQKWNLAATSFAALCMGRTLELLTKAGGIDPKVMLATREADKKAILYILNSEEFYKHGKDFTNQYTGMFAGALAYLKLYPDKAMESLLKKKIHQTFIDFQSQAGYFYIAGGTDHGYNMNTHHSNMRLIYDYTRNTELGAGIIKEEKKYIDWLIFNSVKEPDHNVFTLNRATETRTPAPVVANYILKSPLGESVEGLRVFTPTREEVIAANKQKRKLLTERWPDVGKLEVYSPTVLLHLNRYQWYPTKLQQDAARKKLPHLVKNQFTHQRMDNRLPVIFTFIRQPGYYAVFNSGPVLGSRQRYGLGLLWNAETGSFLQSQPASDVAAWGTRVTGKLVYEAKDLNAEMSVNGIRIVPKAGAVDLPAGTVQVKYALGNSGTKSLEFDKDEIQVNVLHSGAFSEHLPLLVGVNDKISVNESGLIRLEKNGTEIQIIYDASEKASLQRSNDKIGEQSVATIIINARDKLKYVIKTTSRR
jgi:hypothetical protein